MAIVWQSTPVVSSSYSGWEYKLGLDVSTSNLSDTQTKVTVDIWFWSKWNLDSSQYSLYFDFDKSEATTLISDRAEIHTPSSSSWSESNKVKLATRTITYTRGSNDIVKTCAVKITQVAGFKNETGTFAASYTIPAQPTPPVEQTYEIKLKTSTGIISTDGNGFYPVNTKITMSAVVENGYSWLGWSDGNTDNPREFIVTGYYEITAQATPNTYQVIYDSNGGDGPDRQDFLYNTGATIVSTIPTRAGYKFLYWLSPYGVENNMQEIFYPGDPIPTNWGSFRLVAQWEPNTYYVYYDANGGTGAPDTQAYVYGLPIECISDQEPVRSGYKFLRWYCSEYEFALWPGDGIPDQYGNFTLVAQWKKLETIGGLVYIDNGTQFEAYQMFIDSGTNWDQVIPYMDNGTEWNSLL